MNEAQVQAFWGAHPCGEQFVAGADDVGYETFFEQYDRFRYERESHILGCLDAVAFSGKRVLEIGLGLGADSEQIIRRGGQWTGIDLTAESVDRVRTRLELRGLPYDAVTQGSVLDLPFADDSFDVVFSHGVLHHVPDIARAQSEVARVLRPGGEAVVMLYAKYSLNYLISVGIVRRLGLIAMYALHRAGLRFGGIYGRHVENARAVGLARYLSMRTFVHRNTDGPDNPYSKVYSLADVRRDFPSFRIERAHKEFMHAPPLPVARLGFANVAGWHLWVHMRPVPAPPRPTRRRRAARRRGPDRQTAGRSS
jgi:SAM-dependent methyltransferase